MERVLERLGQERDDLRRQIAVLRMDLERETAVSKNFKALQARTEEHRVQQGVDCILGERDVWPFSRLAELFGHLTNPHITLTSYCIMESCRI